MFNGTLVQSGPSLNPDFLLGYRPSDLSDWTAPPPETVWDALDDLAALTSGGPSGPAGGVLSGTYPNPGFSADMATQAELDAHINAIPGAHAASAISVLDTGGHYAATDVEAALAEIYTDLGTIITISAIASPISAAPTGRADFTSDSPYVLVSDGAAINYFGPIRKLTPPVNGNFTWVNQGGASVATTNGGVYIIAPAGAGANLRIREEAQPATPYSVTILYLPDNYPADNATVGVGWRESGTGKLEIMDFVYSAANGGFVLAAESYTSPTVFSATRNLLLVRDIGLPMWWKMVHDGTNLTFQWSTSGYGFQTLATFAKNNFFTTAPDQIFFAAQAANASNAAQAHLVHWLKA